MIGLLHVGMIYTEIQLLTPASVKLFILTRCSGTFMLRRLILRRIVAGCANTKPGSCKQLSTVDGNETHL
jgi:hypothetical protein